MNDPPILISCLERNDEDKKVFIETSYVDNESSMDYEDADEVPDKNILVHFIREHIIRYRDDNHLSGYSLFDINQYGLFLYEGIGSCGIYIGGLDLTPMSELKIIGVDII